MQMRLLVKEGPRTGEEVLVKGPFIIGRSVGDFSTKDSKTSAKHAQISLKNQSIFEIEDLGSSNKTFVNELPIEKRELKIGDRILVGRTLFEVFEITKENLYPKDSWQASIDSALLDSLDDFEKSHPSPLPLHFFNQFVTLEVLKGADAGEKLCFSYGPRKVSPFSAHPKHSFVLESTPEGECKISSLYEPLLVNGRSCASCILKNNDHISVGQIEYVVKFVDAP